MQGCYLQTGCPKLMPPRTKIPRPVLWIELCSTTALVDCTIITPVSGGGDVIGRPSH